MTARTSTRTRKTLVAIGVSALALFTASPAMAIYRSYEPADSEAPAPTRTVERDDDGTKKGCTVTLSTGQSIVYDHGYSFSVVNKATGKTHTYTCVDGKWVETVNAPSPTTDNHWEADNAYVDASNVVQLENPYYATP